MIVYLTYTYKIIPFCINTIYSIRPVPSLVRRIGKKVALLNQIIANRCAICQEKDPLSQVYSRYARSTFDHLLQLENRGVVLRIGKYRQFFPPDH